MLSESQTYEENRKEFVQRLIEAGWSKEEAEAEYAQVQADTESD